uniref:EAL domain-containing protein n=1 Tax=Pseudomonas sp. TH31 TaxID=2796396 RepID=UPI00313E0062
MRLRILGCGLSIDDFGVGFSSLSLLCQLPFNQLKLDGQFVQQLREPGRRAMIASTLALTRSLEMSLVIEGVSSQRIRDQLVAMGCELGQGFHLARPMTGHDLLQWLDGHGVAK